MLQDSLSALWEHLASIGRPIVSSRISNLAPGDVRARLGSAIPDDVADWFSWCNGVRYVDGETQDDASVVPGYWPVSLDEALEIKAAQADDLAFLGDAWIPLLANGGGDFYAAVYGDDSKVSRIVRVISEEGEDFIFASIESMVDGFLELYRQGVFFVNEEGALDADDERWIDFEDNAAS